jgi:hypothetical protein
VRRDRPPGDPRGHFTSTPDYRALARASAHLVRHHWCAKEPALHHNGAPWHRTPAKAARSGAPPLKWMGARAHLSPSQARNLDSCAQDYMHASDVLFDDFQQAESGSGRPECTHSVPAVQSPVIRPQLQRSPPDCLGARRSYSRVLQPYGAPVAACRPRKTDWTHYAWE